MFDGFVEIEPSHPLGQQMPPDPGEIPMDPPYHPPEEPVLPPSTNPIGPVIDPPVENGAASPSFEGDTENAHTV